HHLVGDTSHGDGRHNRHFRTLGIHRMLLHAWRLGFAHPATGVPMRVEAPPDAQCRRALARFAGADDALAAPPAATTARARMAGLALRAGSTSHAEAMAQH